MTQASRSTPTLSTAARSQCCGGNMTILRIGVEKLLFMMTVAQIQSPIRRLAKLSLSWEMTVVAATTI